MKKQQGTTCKKAGRASYIGHFSPLISVNALEACLEEGCSVEALMELDQKLAKDEAMAKVDLGGLCPKHQVCHKYGYPLTLQKVG